MAFKKLLPCISWTTTSPKRFSQPNMKHEPSPIRRTCRVEGVQNLPTDGASTHLHYCYINAASACGSPLTGQLPAPRSIEIDIPIWPARPTATSSCAICFGQWVKIRMIRNNRNSHCACLPSLPTIDQSQSSPICYDYGDVIGARQLETISAESYE